MKSKLISTFQEEVSIKSWIQILLYYMYLKYTYLISFSLMPSWNFRIVEHYKDAFYLISILITRFSILFKYYFKCYYNV